MQRRNTYQKKLIFETIINMDHPSAEEIYQEISKKDSKIGRATVFRNVNTLLSNGAIARINVPNGAIRFESNLTPHSHFKCKCCAKLYDIPNPVVNISNTIHSIEEYDLLFYGVCQKCLEKKKSEEK